MAPGQYVSSAARRYSDYTLWQKAKLSVKLIALERLLRIRPFFTFRLSTATRRLECLARPFIKPMMMDDDDDGVQKVWRVFGVGGFAQDAQGYFKLARLVMVM